MRRVIFNLMLLLLVVVLVASLGAPGATASTQPATSPAVSQVTEHSTAQTNAAPSTLQTDRLFDSWLWSGSNTSAAIAPQPGGAAQRSSSVSQS
jgi:hypothetical protein